MRPIPLVPPWISTDSPAAKRMRSKRLYQTVKKFSGTQAASASDSPGGGGRQKPAGAVQYSAYPPPGVSAHTVSPACHSVTPSPSAAMRPATSSPTIGDASGGGGYAPDRCRQSGRLTPAYATSISTSPGFGTGSGPSAGTSTSGGPGSRTAT